MKQVEPDRLFARNEDSEAGRRYASLSDGSLLVEAGEAEPSGGRQHFSRQRSIASHVRYQ